MSIDADLQKQVDDILGKVNKEFGSGAAMRLGERSFDKIEAYSTGSLALDNALGVGGFPKGRISEVYAEESVGKTTVALHAIADAQKKGGVGLLIDAEHALDPAYAKSLGVDVDSLIISQPETGEQALQILDRFVRSGVIDIAVIDSVAALVPKAELEGQIGDAHVGLQARLMSQALRSLTGAVSQQNTCVIFINQFRAKIGGMGYGPQKTTSGGNALKYFCSVRVEMARTGSDKDTKTNMAINNHIKATVRKNKVAPPMKIALFDIFFGKGIEPIRDTIGMGESLKIIKKSGSWYSYNGDQLGQGKEGAVKALEENPELFKEIRKLVVEAINPVALSENVDIATGEITDED